MSSLELAHKYMEIFYSGRDPEELRDIFSVDLTFKGPFFEFDTAESYIDSLKADPPEGMHYRIISAYESGTSACLIYEFSKSGVCIPMAQMFEVADDRISSILLIFDTGAFS